MRLPATIFRPVPALLLAAALAGCSAGQKTARSSDVEVRPADASQPTQTTARSSVSPRIGVMAAMDVEADSLADVVGTDEEAIAEAEPLERLPWADDTTDAALDDITVSRYYYDDDGTYYYDEEGTSVYDGDGHGGGGEYSSYAADYYRYDDPYYYASPYVYYRPYTSYSPYYSYGWCRSRYYGHWGGYGRSRCYRPYGYAGWYGGYGYDPYYYDPYFYGGGLHVSFGWGFGFYDNYGYGYHNGYRNGYWDGYHDGGYRYQRPWRYQHHDDRRRRGYDDGERGDRVGDGARIAQAPLGGRRVPVAREPGLGKPTLVRKPEAHVDPTRDPRDPRITRRVIPEETAPVVTSPTRVPSRGGDVPATRQPRTTAPPVLSTDPRATDRAETPQFRSNPDQTEVTPPTRTPRLQPRAEPSNPRTAEPRRAEPRRAEPRRAEPRRGTEPRRADRPEPPWRKRRTVQGHRRRVAVQLRPAA